MPVALRGVRGSRPTHRPLCGRLGAAPAALQRGQGAGAVALAQAGGGRAWGLLLSRASRRQETGDALGEAQRAPVSYTHLRAHETGAYL
eukprot:749319-Pyramimonas_sp.AAC.1